MIDFVEKYHKELFPDKASTNESDKPSEKKQPNPYIQNIRDNILNSEDSE